MMSDTLAPEHLTAAHVRGQTHKRRRAQSSPDIGRMKNALAQVDENLRQRPLPTIALALALGFVAARLAIPQR
jgi:hypothetical protein